MEADERTSLEDEVAAFLVVCDEALAAGKVPTLRFSAETPPELQARMQRNLGTLRGLRCLSREARADRAAQTPPPPGRLGRFLIRRELGRGAFGLVFLAHDPRLDREVALKIPQGEALLPEQRERFLQEAKAAAALDHPHLVPIYEAGMVGSVCCIVSAYCPGGTLAERLRHGGPLPAGPAADLAAALALAMQYAHEQGVIHRDLKPSNVFLGADGTPRVGDFGLARQTDGGARLTHTGAVLGTPLYMAPEQARGRKDVGVAADVYGLGVILYESLTGRPPFQAASVADVLHQVLHDEPVPLSRLDPTVPRDLETICLKCLRKEPEKRYASARELADDLERFRGGRPIQARPVGRAQRLRRWCRRNPALASAVALTVSLLVAITAVSLGWALHASRLIGEVREALGNSEDGRLGAQEQLAQRHFDRALIECERGEVGLGMLWLARSLETAPERSRDLDAALRASLAAWHSRLLPLTHCREGVVARASPSFVPPETLAALAHSHDGRTVLTAEYRPIRQGGDTMIRRRDARTGQPIGPAVHCQGAISALALSPDGQTILAAQVEDGLIRAWDVATGQSRLLLIPRGKYRILAYSPDGRCLLTGSWDQTARLWDVATGRQRGPTLHHPAPVQAVAFHRDGTVLTSDTRTTRTWAVAAGPAPASVFVHDRPVRTVSFSPDGQTIATGTFDRTARLWSVRPGARAKPLPHRLFVDTVLFSPDGRSLATADWSGFARLWETASGSPKGTVLQHDKHVRALAFSDSGQLVLTGSYDGTARVWDATTGAMRARFRHGAAVAAVAFDRAAARVLTGGVDGTARLWSVATGGPLGNPLKHRAAVRAVAFDRQGDRVLTGSEDGTACLWDAETGQPCGPAMQHGGEVWVAAFSRDGRQIVTGSWDGTARLWDAATGRPRGRPLDHRDQVRAAAFSRDGRRVVTGSFDGTARLWDAATGRPLGPSLPHEGRVWAVAFGPGNQTVLTGSEDRKARLWQMPPPIEGSVEQVVLWVQVHTGMELDAGGGVHVLEASAWQQLRQRLAQQQKELAPFIPRGG